MQMATSALQPADHLDLVTLLMACGGTVDASASDCDPDEYDPGLFLAQPDLAEAWDEIGGDVVAVPGHGRGLQGQRFCLESDGEVVGNALVRVG